MEVSGQLHTLAALPPGKESPIPSLPWIGGWMGPRAGLDAVSERKILSLHRESNPDHLTVLLMASYYTD
jgi:hypothetical protein